LLDDRLKLCSDALEVVSDDLRTKLLRKLVGKQKAKGKRAITEADQRRWELPKGQEFQHWTVPFDTDPDHPKPLSDAINAYRAAWRAKMDDVNACVAKNALLKELVNEPVPMRGVVRVSGPFTVEAVQPPEQSLDSGPESPIGGDPETLEESFAPSGTSKRISIR
jgi:adenine-specific DNA-methyltransferase